MTYPSIDQLIDLTSGNTGIGLCAVAFARRCGAIILMPDIMSVERHMLMKAMES